MFFFSLSFWRSDELIISQPKSSDFHSNNERQPEKLTCWYRDRQKHREREKDDIWCIYLCVWKIKSEAKWTYNFVCVCVCVLWILNTECESECVYMWKSTPSMVFDPNLFMSIIRWCKFSNVLTSITASITIYLYLIRMAYETELWMLITRYFVNIKPPPVENSRSNHSYFE